MAIIDTSCEGDRQLFAVLYPDLRRFAAVVGPVEEDPDDLVQEALARTLQRHDLMDLDHPGAYLRRAILNLAKNSRRRLARARRAMSRLVPEDEPKADSYPSDLADLAVLPPHQRAVLYLSEVEGLTYAGIGALLGCSEAAARKRAMHGRRRLRTTLMKEATDV